MKIAHSSGLKLWSCTIGFFLKGLVFSKTDVQNAKKRTIFCFFGKI